MIPKFKIGNKLYWVNVPFNINHGDYTYSIYECDIVYINITPEDCRESEKGIEYRIAYNIGCPQDHDAINNVYVNAEWVDEEVLFATQEEAVSFVNKHFADWEKENDNESI